MIIEEITLLSERIKNVSNQVNKPFTHISSKDILDNLNIIYGTKYTIEDINYVLGFIYEKEFNHHKLEEREF